MFFTIGDVKASAKVLYPTASRVTVERIYFGDPSRNGYRLFVVYERNRMLSRLTAPTIGALKAKLNGRLKGASSESDANLDISTPYASNSLRRDATERVPG